eukprot:SAG31_NODE_7796_length_1594_cov_6.293645_2_plen_178_part_00
MTDVVNNPIHMKTGIKSGVSSWAPSGAICPKFPSRGLAVNSRIGPARGAAAAGARAGATRDDRARALPYRIHVLAAAGLLPAACTELPADGRPRPRALARTPTSTARPTAVWRKDVELAEGSDCPNPTASFADSTCGRGGGKRHEARADGRVHGHHQCVPRRGRPAAVGRESPAAAQ